MGVGVSHTERVDEEGRGRGVAIGADDTLDDRSGPWVRPQMRRRWAPLGRAIAHDVVAGVPIVVPRNADRCAPCPSRPAPGARQECPVRR